MEPSKFPAQEVFWFFVRTLDRQLRLFDRYGTVFAIDDGLTGFRELFGITLSLKDVSESFDSASGSLVFSVLRSRTV